jgi:hypothetical protein
MAKNQVTLTFAGDSRSLERTFDRVGDGARKMQSEVSRTSGTFTVAGDGIQGFASKIGKFGIAAAALGVTAVIAVAHVGKDIFELSRSLVDMDRKAAAVFETQLPAITKWAELNRKSFGTSTREVVNLASSMADLLKPMGFTAKQATDMSMKTLGLAGALAKWSGGTKTAAEVSDILTKAMLGERDMLKGLGISISEADVKARLLAKGQQDLTGAAEAQATAVATQELIFEKSADAQKAWAEGGKVAAEAQGALGSAVDTLKEKIATLLTPAFNAAAVAAGDFVDKLNSKVDELAPKVKSFAETELAGLGSALTDLKDNVLGGVAAGFEEIKIKVGENSDEWREAGKNLADLIEIIGPGLKKTLQGVGWLLGEALDDIVILINAIAKLVEWYKRVLDLAHTLGMISGGAPVAGGVGQMKSTAPSSGSTGQQTNPRRFHAGSAGPVPGPPGAEMLAVLQAGERVSPRGASDKTVIEVRSSGSDVDDLIAMIIERVVDRRGGDVQLAFARR